MGTSGLGGGFYIDDSFFTVDFTTGNGATSIVANSVSESFLYLANVGDVTVDLGTYTALSSNS